MKRIGVISFHVDFKSSEIQKKKNMRSSLQYINKLNFPPMLKTEHGKFILLSGVLRNVMCTLRPFMIGVIFNGVKQPFKMKYYLTQGFNHFSYI